MGGRSLGFAALFWFLFNLLLKSKRKAAVATSILILILFTYGHFYDLINRWDTFISSHTFLIPVALLGFLACLYFIRRSQSNFIITTHFLNVAASVLIVINIFTVIIYEVSVFRLSTPEEEFEVELPDEIDYMPDIYLIILDEYAHADTLEEYFNYNNEPFLKSLEERGFFIADESTMHNEKSVRAIASILNMEQTPEDEDRRISHQRIANNKVVNLLSAIGYKYVYFGHWYEIDRYTVEADEYYNYYEDADYGVFSAELTGAFLHSTMLRPLFDNFAGDDYQNFYQDGLVRTFDHLANLPEYNEPRFTFAHLMSPHAPYVFNANGEPVDLENYFNVDYYIGQLIYTNQQVDRIIDNILDESKNEPIIILQSDHGPRWVPEWKNILNAYYLPDDAYEILDDAISPVDTFRVLLDHYFGIEIKRTN